MMNDTKPKILLVDDDRLAHERLHNLTANRYDLHSAYNGQEGMTRALECSPDLILLDVMMPGMDGLTVCSNLRAHPLLNDIPIIILTALSGQDTRLKCIMEGADDFLTKPFDELEMSLRLRNLLQVNRYRRLQNERLRTQWLLDNATEAFLILDEQLAIQYANHQAAALFSLSQPIGIGELVNFQTVVCDYNAEPRGLWDAWLSEPLAKSSQGLHLMLPATTARPGKTLVMRTHVQHDQNRTSILVRLLDSTAEAHAQTLRWNFHYHVAHKLFTPLTGLKAGLQMLEDTAVGKLDQAELEALQIALLSCGRLLADCQKVVDYIELNGTTGSTGVFALQGINALCSEIWSLAGIRMAVCDLDARLLQRALAISEISLTAILVELTTNSRKFSLVGPPQITLRIESSGKDTAILRFSDAGTHIPPEHLNKVWLPHFQAEKLITGSVMGMGLGLSSIALQVWQAGGAFSVKNNDLGKGVTVTLEIPLVKPAAAESLSVQHQ